MFSEECARALLAAIVKQAVRDARAGRKCNCDALWPGDGLQRCSWDAHVCAEDALRFLESEAFAAICRYLGIAHLLHRLPEATVVAPAVFVGA